MLERTEEMNTDNAELSIDDVDVIDISEERASKYKYPEQEPYLLYVT